MDARQLSYLRAMGVDVWLSRDTAVEEMAAPVEPPTPEPRRHEVRDETSTGGLDWPTLEARVKACQACGLHTTRTQTVFGVGNRTARWMIIGEAPGAEEDRQGEPFVGRAGQLLNAML